MSDEAIRSVARAALAVLDSGAAPLGDDVKQLVADAAVGRAVREAAAVAPSEPLIHICWVREDGRMDGKYLSDTHLYSERMDLAAAAQELLEATETDPTP